MNGFVKLATPEAVAGFLAVAERELSQGGVHLTAGRLQPVVVFENADEAAVARLAEVAARSEGRLVPATRYAPLGG